jgi:hypothetical protein
MTQGIKDPTTGKTYTFKGLAPLRRVTEACNHDDHAHVSLLIKT